MNILFLDCESNGYAKFKEAKPGQRTGRVISLAWELTDHDGKVQSSHDYLIRPEGGWKIPQTDFHIKHGYFTWKNTKEGFPIKQVLMLFVLDLNRAEVIVAHNLVFDKKLVLAELTRAGILTGNMPHEFCTMKESKKHCGLLDVAGRPKPPRLSELYQILFGKYMEGSHQALQDVRCCKECFFELVKREIIKLPETV